MSIAHSKEKPSIALLCILPYKSLLAKDSPKFLRLLTSSKRTITTEVIVEERVETTSKQYAFVSCSIHSTIEAYCFYMPMVTLAWRRLGYEVIVILVGDFINLNNTKPDDIQLVIKYVHAFGGKTLEFQSPQDYAMKISQTIRLFIGFLPLNFVNDDDYFIITDSDLLPLHREQYMLEKGYPDGFIVNRYCCGFFFRRNRSYHMIPMGHLYMKRYLWREIILQSIIQKELITISQNFYQYTNGSHEYEIIKRYKKKRFDSLLLTKDKIITYDIMSLYLRQEFRQTYDERTVKGGTGWDMDQVLITMLLFDYLNSTTDGQKLKIHERGLLGRLDRSVPFLQWSTRSNFSEFGDAHITHNIFEKKFWYTHLRLFKSLFNETCIKLLNEYYKGYLLLRLI
ncbi:unnamed protein product [Rotaria sp. Silwood1]|nr:unnamed protein product [Rotaria sp. Silwood1]CAF4553119.1 unnamed protein product [Rotaria sp. Silwood1]CAF4587892.1 unnamed protein product [Rotaria sp. Silwood1]